MAVSRVRSGIEKTTSELRQTVSRRLPMSRVLKLLVVIAVICGANVSIAAPAATEQVSRYEREVLRAQKRLIKHRHQKAKQWLKRQRQGAASTR